MTLRLTTSYKPSNDLFLENYNNTEEEKKIDYYLSSNTPPLEEV